MASTFFKKYEKAIENWDGTKEYFHSNFPLNSFGNVYIRYAPFEYVNRDAKLTLLGMTPSWTQIRENLDSAQKSISSPDVLKKCKLDGSFAQMRELLVAQLDYFKFDQYLKRFEPRLRTCKELFVSSSTIGTKPSDLTYLVNYTSIYKFPTFYLNKKTGNLTSYTCNQGVYKAARQKLDDYFIPMLEEEFAEAKTSIILPLGIAVTDALKKSSTYSKYRDRILPPILCPSGQNNLRINYLLGLIGKSKMTGANSASKVESLKQNLQKAMLTKFGITPT